MHYKYQEHEKMLYEIVNNSPTIQCKHYSVQQIKQTLEEEKKKKQENRINNWVLKGLSNYQKNSLNKGTCFEKLTAIPVDIGAAAFLMDVARSLYMVKGNQDGKNISVLDPTCGIGISTFVFSMFFGSVHMGDYQQEQLDAAKHNVMNVFNLASDKNISIDSYPINLLDRKDFFKYDIVVLEPNWGDNYHEKCAPGSYRMLLRKGNFDRNTWERVWMTRGNVDDSSCMTHSVSLEDVVTSILKEPNTKVNIVLLHVPSVYEFEYMQSEFQKQGLAMQIYDPTQVTPVSNISYDFLSKFEAIDSKHARDHLIHTFSEEYKNLSTFKHYHGEDRYVAVYRLHLAGTHS